MTMGIIALFQYTVNFRFGISNSLKQYIIAKINVNKKKLRKS